MRDPSRCSACQEAPVLTGGLCERCLDEVHPPIEARGSRWSPLALGTLSLVCDPLLIPTFMAIKRGFEELREVRLRELVGIWSPEHARVRTGAVWGMFFGAGRILAFLVVFTTAVFAGQLAQLDAPPPVPRAASYDELGEVLARLEVEDEATARMALRHLPAVVAEAEDLGTERRALSAVAALEPGPTRDAAILAVLEGLPPIGEALAQPALAAHEGASIETQNELLVRMASGLTSPSRELPDTPAVGQGRRGDEQRVRSDPSAALQRALSDHRDAVEPLADLPDSPAVQRVLLSLPVTHPYARLGAERFAASCADGDPLAGDLGVAVHAERAVAQALEEARAPIEADTRVTWYRPAPVAEPESLPLRVRHAARVVPLLACLSSASARATLEGSIRDDEPRIAAAAIATVREYGPDPRAHAARLPVVLRDPLARADWHARELELPERFQGPAAFAEAEGAAALERAGRVCTDARVEQEIPDEAGSSRVRVEHSWDCVGGRRVTMSAPLERLTAHGSADLASEILLFGAPGCEMAGCIFGAEMP